MSAGPVDLLERFKNGDDAALDLLVEQMAPRLKGFFLRQGATGDIAEDLAQDVFVRVLNGLHRYQAAGRLDAFLLRIARNLWIDFLRRKRPLASTDVVQDAVDESDGPVDLAVCRDRAEYLRRLLASCEPDTRELLELAVLQKLPYAEVAMILEIPVGTVKSRVFYALRYLRERASAAKIFGEEMDD